MLEMLFAYVLRLLDALEANGASFHHHLPYTLLHERGTSKLAALKIKQVLQLPQEITLSEEEDSQDLKKCRKFARNL